jgi:lysophospholipase L1-like esterase
MLQPGAMRRSRARLRPAARLVGALALASAAAATSSAAGTAGSPAPPPNAAPLARATPTFPGWPKACFSYSDPAQRGACLEYVANDFGRLDRYAEANRSLPTPAPGERRVVFFGDSMVERWSENGAGGFFPGKPYVNRGIGGQTTAQMLLRFRQDVIDLRPAAVVILAGTNDIAANGGPTTLEAIAGNLASMADLARAGGIRVVVGSLLPVCDCAPAGDGTRIVQTRERPPAAIAELNRRLAAWAREQGHVWVDYAGAMADGTGMLERELTNDGLHPNAAGYAVMAPLTEQAIGRALN